uniref:UDP-MurNAc-pentapeptide synthetase n=2 Tax=Anthurium amnicola TaxID=1678845 RepID=A0A1D1XN61_9ARAE
MQVEMSKPWREGNPSPRPTSTATTCPPAQFSVETNQQGKQTASSPHHGPTPARKNEPVTVAMVHGLAAPPCFPFSAPRRPPKPSRVRAAGVRHWTAEEIAGATDGRVVAWGPPGPISSDTRTLRPGQWFLAISGENFDGHDFVGPELEAAGCAGVVGNRVGAGWRGGFVRVEGDTVVALERMAGYARSRHRGVLVGVTGSVGKTTTTAMTALAVGSLGRVYKTPGNWNNRIGVALTLAGMPDGVDVAVVELATRSKGKLLHLAGLARPSVRVILNVGYGHTVFFRTLQGVAEAKGEMLAEARPGDLCVLNADDPLVMAIPLPPGVDKVFFGRTLGSDVRLVHAESIDGGCSVRVILENKLSTRRGPHQLGNTSEMVEFKIPSPGVHLAINACAAAAVATSLGAPLHQVGDSLSRFTPVPMRSQIKIADNGIRIIDDTYNANPHSMTAAVNLLNSLDCSGRKLIVLGDMFELGAHDAEAHEAILRMCCEACFDLVAVAGRCFNAAAEKLDPEQRARLICESDTKSLAVKVVETLSVDDTVLVKGAVQMEMGKVVDTIMMISGQCTALL